MKKLLVTLYLISTAIFSLSQCIGDITYTVDIPPAADNTYPPSTTVELCVTMTNWNGNAEGSNWLEGFGLTLGTGWVDVQPAQSPDDAEADASGTWLWMTDVTSDATGLTAGPGYFFEGPTGPTDGNPGNDWGDFCGTGDCVWTFCVQLTSSATSGDPLDIEVTPFADGSMGSWGTEMCFDPPTSIFTGTVGCTICGCTDPLACNYDPTVCCDDGTCDYFSMSDITHNFVPCPDTTCTGSEVTYSVNGNESSTYIWNITGGGLVTTDQTSSCEIIWGDVPDTYTITVQEITSAGCEGELKSCDVVVVIPDIIFDTTIYSMCLNASEVINALPMGGIWISDHMNGSTFVGTMPGTYYPSYVTNIHGCDISEDIEVVVKRKYEAPDIIYSSEIINLCNDSYTQSYIADDTIGFTYGWFIDNVRQPTIDNQMQIEWYDTTRTYTIKVIAYDEIGCESEPKLISVRTEACQRFFAPSSFTPNGDGVNDIFNISGLSVYRPSLKIFNRWGVEVYVSSNLWWTGDSGGGYYCDNGVYNWTIEYKDKFGQNKQESGHVTLIR